MNASPFPLRRRRTGTRKDGRDDAIIRRGHNDARSLRRSPRPSAPCVGRAMPEPGRYAEADRRCLTVEPRSLPKADCKPKCARARQHARLAGKRADLKNAWRDKPVRLKGECPVNDAERIVSGNLGGPHLPRLAARRNRQAHQSAAKNHDSARRRKAECHGAGGPESQRIGNVRYM